MVVRLCTLEVPRDGFVLWAGEYARQEFGFYEYQRTSALIWPSSPIVRHCSQHKHSSCEIVRRTDEAATWSKQTEIQYVWCTEARDGVLLLV